MLRNNQSRGNAEMSPKTLITALSVAAVLTVGGMANGQTPRLNPNTATATQLSAVPGVTPALAASLQSKKPFKSTADFNTAVRATLSAEQAAALYPQLFVPINLNTATREEIALIPGMTPRMVREFLEYRPYTSIDQFNREIGKYVDQTELARLRSYVALN